MSSGFPALPPQWWYGAGDTVLVLAFMPVWLFCGSWRLELRSSCLHSRHFADSAISPALGASNVCLYPFSPNPFWWDLRLSVSDLFSTRHLSLEKNLFIWNVETLERHPSKHELYLWWGWKVVCVWGEVNMLRLTCLQMYVYVCTPDVYNIHMPVHTFW